MTEARPLLRHLRRCNRWTPDFFVPFVVADQQVGWVRREFIPVCSRHPEVFGCSDDRVAVLDRWQTVEDRTRAMDPALRRMAEEGHFTKWRDELYAAVTAPGASPLLYLERAAVARFGILGTGVHLNGYLTQNSRPHMWIGKRALDKPTAPGKLDQLVAGGQPATLSLMDNLIKECAEEADIPEHLARRARPVGAISYQLERENGMRRDILYVYDLEVPADFTPRNTDGEIDHFLLWSIERIIEELETADSFKFNCALVVIDFLIRHGHLPPEHPEYLALQQGLRTHDGRLQSAPIAGRPDSPISLDPPPAFP
ncbi:DUF4743 domain-containing protein [Magnetospira sp. QH-2]|uniref:DUF4743 domain-containing protein n=1 Tax=Magnetospira sp. (strain QH-2) TaxID=1288970 RepID=UPI0003E814CE|nr:DUF4743 domain-containing protein [Magnetospira sp. QH-2]CCQ72440.1 Putative NTP pyrophosphohydrolases including oxidative damage repair enzymes [Magnetospira sp. QH-2]